MSLNLTCLHVGYGHKNRQPTFFAKSEKFLLLLHGAARKIYNYITTNPLVYLLLPMPTL
jgi:hypothetical protein